MFGVMAYSEKRSESGESGSSSGLPRRINVAVSPEMLAAIDNVIEREQTTLTEAVRRLIGYGDFVYRAVKQDGNAVFLRDQRGSDTREREVIIL